MSNTCIYYFIKQITKWFISHFCHHIRNNVTRCIVDTLLETGCLLQWDVQQNLDSMLLYVLSYSKAMSYNGPFENKVLPTKVTTNHAQAPWSSRHCLALLL